MRQRLLISLLLLAGCHVADRQRPVSLAAPADAPAKEIAVPSLAPGAGALDRAARVAVVAALERAGYRERAGSAARAEFGIAERPLQVKLDGDPPPTRHALPSLCRRRSYLLSIAIIDRAGGKVRARGAAAAARCRAPDDAFLARLASAAVARL